MVRFPHSRFGLIIAALIVVVCAVAYNIVSPETFALSDSGFVRGWDIGVFGSLTSQLSMSIALAANIAIALMMIYLNRAFNVLRCMTMLQASLFLFFQLATPLLLLRMLPGTSLCLMLSMCMVLMFAGYGRKDFQRPIYLAFCLLSACSAIDYAFAVYIPALWIGLVQMRAFSLRSLLASIMGVATPWIIYLGLGIVEISRLQVPSLISGVNMEQFMSLAWLTVATAIFTTLVALGALMQNIIKVISYKAQSRAVLGFINVIMAFTIIAMFTNTSHLYAFLPMLNCCAAWQLGHVFGVIHRKPGSQWAILLMIFVYFMVFAWRTAICIL